MDRRSEESRKNPRRFSNKTWLSLWIQVLQHSSSHVSWKQLMHEILCTEAFHIFQSMDSSLGQGKPDEIHKNLILDVVHPAPWVAPARRKATNLNRSQDRKLTTAAAVRPASHASGSATAATAAANLSRRVGGRRESNSVPFSTATTSRLGRHLRPLRSAQFRLLLLLRCDLPFLLDPDVRRRC